MIYAPPSREKSKQTVRSPQTDKPDEYLMTAGNGYSGQGIVSTNHQARQ
jgi:hypothetical protein